MANLPVQIYIIYIDMSLNKRARSYLEIDNKKSKSLQKQSKDPFKNLLPISNTHKNTQAVKLDKKQRYNEAMILMGWKKPIIPKATIHATRIRSKQQQIIEDNNKQIQICQNKLNDVQNKEDRQIKIKENQQEQNKQQVIHKQKQQQQGQNIDKQLKDRKKQFIKQNACKMQTKQRQKQKYELRKHRNITKQSKQASKKQRKAMKKISKEQNSQYHNPSYNSQIIFGTITHLFK